MFYFCRIMLGAERMNNRAFIFFMYGWDLRHVDHRSICCAAEANISLSVMYALLGEIYWLVIHSSSSYF